jgi:hypothetical protein
LNDELNIPARQNGKLVLEPQRLHVILGKRSASKDLLSRQHLIPLQHQQNIAVSQSFLNQSQEGLYPFILNASAQLLQNLVDPLYIRSEQGDDPFCSAFAVPVTRRGPAPSPQTIR